LVATITFEVSVPYEASASAARISPWPTSSA
jgi:hypothetical protein